MRIASICGDIILMPPELAEGLLIPSSKATPAWVAMPPLLELLLMENNVWIDSSFFGAFELVNENRRPQPKGKALEMISLTDLCMEMGFWFLQWGRPCSSGTSCAYFSRPSPATSWRPAWEQVPVLPFSRTTWSWPRWDLKCVVSLFLLNEFFYDLSRLM